MDLHVIPFNNGFTRCLRSHMKHIMNLLHIGKNNKKVLLIGCGGTFGSELAKHLSRTHYIIGVAREKPKHKYVADFIPGDVSEDPEQIITKVLRSHSNIDVLIDNAVMLDSVELIHKSPYTIEKEMRTNLSAPIRLSNALMHQSWLDNNDDQNITSYSSKCIIHVGSTAGIYFSGACKHSIYAPTKAALHMLTWHMAAEYKTHNVRVNAVAPWYLNYGSVLGRSLDVVSETIESQTTGKVYVVGKEKNYTLQPRSV